MRLVNHQPLNRSQKDFFKIGPGRRICPGLFVFWAQNIMLSVKVVRDRKKGVDHRRTLEDNTGRSGGSRRLPFRQIARIWGHSSAGRAPALQAGGRRFDPVWLHQFLFTHITYPMC